MLDRPRSRLEHSRFAASSGVTATELGVIGLWDNCGSPFVPAAKKHWSLISGGPGAASKADRTREGLGFDSY